MQDFKAVQQMRDQEFMTKMLGWGAGEPERRGYQTSKSQYYGGSQGGNYSGYYPSPGS